MQKQGQDMRQTNPGEIEAVGTRPLSELAYELITSKIIRLELPPGTALVEKNLMEELEFGRTPVREALQRLTVEGLICRTHYRGVYVCEVTEDSVARIAEFRMLTDPVIARHAVERGSESDIALLTDCLEQLREHLAALKFDVYTRTSRRFYLALAQAADNLHLEEAAKHIYNFDARLLYFAARTDTEWKTLTQARLENAAVIVDCMRRRSAAEAEAATKLYLVRYFAEISRLVKESGTADADFTRITLAASRA